MGGFRRQQNQVRRDAVFPDGGIKSTLTMKNSMAAAAGSHFIDGHGIVGKPVDEGAQGPGGMGNPHLVSQKTRMVNPCGIVQIGF
jgi:hypothetical protein